MFPVEYYIVHGVNKIHSQSIGLADGGLKLDGTDASPNKRIFFN